jgi:hypothetical protein
MYLPVCFVNPSVATKNGAVPGRVGPDHCFHIAPETSQRKKNPCATEIESTREVGEAYVN